MTSFNIYDHASETHINKFKPTFLYIKRHAVTGKLYFGKTSKTNNEFEKYNGSGTYWVNHIKSHGEEHVETIWFCYFTEVESLVEFAINFSKSQQIVESTEWANQTEENGLGGWQKDVNVGRTPYSELILG